MDQYVELSGGLDLETPPVTAGAGTALLAENVYESVKGGYTTVAGYERFDGQDKPSSEAYYQTVWELLALGGGMSLALDSVVGDAVTIDGNVGEILYSINDTVDEIAVLFKGDGTGAPLVADYPITITTTGGSTYNLVHMVAQGGPTQSYETLTRDQYILVPQNIQRAKILFSFGSQAG